MCFGFLIVWQTIVGIKEQQVVLDGLKSYFRALLIVGRASCCNINGEKIVSSSLLILGAFHSIMGWYYITVFIVIILYFIY